MKVFHFILGKANRDRANGVNQVIAGLSKYSACLGAEVRVIGKAETATYEGEVIERDGFSVEIYSRWSYRLRSALIESIRWADVVHLHGVYSPWNLFVAWLCQKAGTPYVVTLHDGLAAEREGARSRYKKKIFHMLLQKRYLEAAAAVHVITQEEATDLYAMAQPKYVFCVPNGVDLEDYPPYIARHAVVPNELSIGYLGRLSSEKNLVALCEAFTKINAQGNHRLKIAGPETEFGRDLFKRYAGKGIEWVGAKFGDEKTTFIKSLDLFVHPSLCDVFSIAGMEVMALGTPLLITRTSKACYFYDSGGFFMCEPTEFGLEQGLLTALAARDKWPAMTVKARDLIECQLNWHSAAKDMLAAYERVLVKVDEA